MARVKNIDGLKLSGTIGGLVFVQVGDQTYVRTRPERKKDSWSEKQGQHRKRFAAFTRFYRMMSAKFVKPIWNLQATKNVTGYNLFMKANLSAFDESGKTTDPSILRFSSGPLALPLHFSVIPDNTNPRLVQLCWDPKCISRTEKPDDELLVAEGDHTKVTGPVATNIHRVTGNAVINLSDFQEKQMYHFHFFFASSNRDKYSPDYYYQLMK